MKTYIQRPTVELYIGGCSGSNVPQAERSLRKGDDPSSVIDRPVSRTTFGIHTTSLALLLGDTGIIIDNGTGVGQAAEFLKARCVSSVYIFNTHYHHDHVAGLMVNPFLLFDSKVVKGIFGPMLGQSDFASVIDQYYAPPFWPIGPKMLGIKLPVFSFNPGNTISVLGGVKTLMLNHAGGSVAYRIPTVAGDIVIATDNELSNDDIRKKVAGFITGAKLVYVDVQYRDDEYENKRIIGPGGTSVSRKNWGHSTPDMMVKTYEQIITAPEITLVGHHDPKRSDEDLFAFEEELKIRLEYLGTEVRFARELQKLPLQRTMPPKDEEVVAGR